MEGLLPFNQNAEEVLVGSFFLEGELVKECTIKPEQIYSWRLRKLYTAIRRLDEKGIPIDIISLLEEIGIENIKELGGVSYLNQLAASVPTTANFFFYEKLVKEYHQKRKAIEVAEKIMEDAHEAEISKTLINKEYGSFLNLDLEGVVLNA